MNGSPSRTLIGAAVAFTIALFLFGSALLRAFSAGTVLLPAPAPTAAAAASADNTGYGLDSDALQLAVENDPFSPQRQPPAERYRLPGDVEPEPEAAPPPPPPPPAFRVSGTMVTASGKYALISVGDAPPRFMAVGETSIGYRLSDVTEATATMSNDERDILLRVPAPAQRIAQAPQGRPGTQRGPQPSVGQALQNAQQTAAIMRQIIERARQSGASPQQIEQIMRMVTERGIVAIDELEIGPNSFSIRGRDANGGQMRSTSTTNRTDTMAPRPPIRREP